MPTFVYGVYKYSLSFVKVQYVRYTVSFPGHQIPTHLFGGQNIYNLGMTLNNRCTQCTFKIFVLICDLRLSFMIGITLASFTFISQVCCEYSKPNVRLSRNA